MLKLSIAGTCLGFALSLSLRRYLPSQFGELSFKRVVVDSFLVLGGYVYFSKMATYQIYQNLTPLRKQLVDECNQDYLKNLLHFQHDYPKCYNSNADVFKDVYTEKELKEWVIKNANIAQLFGIQPYQFEGQKDELQKQLTVSESSQQENNSSAVVQSNYNNKSNQEQVYSFNFKEEQNQNKK